MFQVEDSNTIVIVLYFATKPTVLPRDFRTYACRFRNIVPKSRIISIKKTSKSMTFNFNSQMLFSLKKYFYFFNRFLSLFRSELKTIFLISFKISAIKRIPFCHW